MTTEPSFEIRYAHLPTGATISYEVSGDGVTVVLMPRSITDVLGLPPGQTTLARRWSQSNLSRRLRLGIPDARIVEYTHLGGSMSDRAGYDFTLDGLEAELEAVVSAAVDGAFVLVAWGITSPVAISYAASHPDRVIALGLLRPWLRGSDYTSSETFRSFRPALEGDWVLGTETYAAFASGLAGHERRARAALVRDTVEQSTFLDYLDAIADHDASAVAGSVSISTFVLGFADDLFSPPSSAQEVARAIPDARLEQLDGEEALYDRGVELVASMVEAHATAGRETVEHGLQTVLFTDLAGSTAMQSRLGDEGAMEVLRAHDAAVRQAIGEFNGREVKRTGDGTMATFSSAADAVNCALTVRRDIETYNDTHEGEELRVRFGINAGEPIADDGDLFGLSVTLAARIGDWGEPGQVLCSNVVRELLLGKGFEFTSVGSAELKGLDEPVPLYEVRG